MATSFAKDWYKKAKEIHTWFEAENFFQNYGLFVQVRDILCDTCFSKLRLKKSKWRCLMTMKNAEILLDVDDSSHAIASTSIPQQVREEEVVQLSQSSLEDSAVTSSSQISSH